MPKKLDAEPKTSLDRAVRQRLERRWKKEHPTRTHELRESMKSQVARWWPSELGKDQTCYRAWRRAVSKWKRQTEDGDCYEADIIPPSVTTKAREVRQKIDLPAGEGQWVQRWVEHRLIFGDAEPAEHEDKVPEGWLEIEVRALIPGHPAAYVQLHESLSDYTVGELTRYFEEARQVVVDQLSVRWPAKRSQEIKPTKETHDQRYARLMVDSEFAPKNKRRSLKSLATDEPVTLDLKRTKRELGHLKKRLGLV
jgi:hypothetical protein